MMNQTSKLVAVYKSHDIRDASDDFGPMFHVYHAGKMLADRDSLEAAREYIDQKVAREDIEIHDTLKFFDDAVAEIKARDAAPVAAAGSGSSKERFARNMKLMGRHENRPDDLI